MAHMPQELLMGRSPHELSSGVHVQASLFWNDPGRSPVGYLLCPVDPWRVPRFQVGRESCFREDILERERGKDEERGD